MRPPHIRLLQTRLAALGHDPGPPDGRLGPRTAAAIRAALPAFAPPPGWTLWPARRQATALLQSLARAAGHDTGPIDGHFGPQTDHAADLLLFPHLADWRDRPPPVASPWPTEAQVPAFYGPQGTPDGRRPPLVQVPSPWPFRIAWNLSQTRSFLWAHERTAPSVSRILSRIHHHYGQQRIRDLRLDIFSGDYAPRRMRGSQTRWSMHAWGIAYDFDDSENRLHWGADRARLARPEYHPFWDIWESEGWVSLGRARNYDWMHVQAARPD